MLERRPQGFDRCAFHGLGRARWPFDLEESAKIIGMHRAGKDHREVAVRLATPEILSGASNVSQTQWAVSAHRQFDGLLRGQGTLRRMQPPSNRQFQLAVEWQRLRWDYFQPESRAVGDLAQLLVIQTLIRRVQVGERSPMRCAAFD